MDLEKKKIQIADIQDRFSRMSSALVTDFRGLNVEKMNSLRVEFGKLGVEYKVIKNKLFGIAVQEEPYHEKLSTHLVEPTAVAWSYDDPSAAAKVAVNFSKKNENLRIKCAILDGQVLEGAEVVQLSKMPGKDEIKSQLLATFMAPAQGFVRHIAAAPTNFVYLLDAKRRQKEEE